MKTYRQRFALALLLSTLLHGGILGGGILYSYADSIGPRSEEIYEVSDLAERLASTVANRDGTVLERQKKPPASQLHFVLMDTNVLQALEDRTAMLAGLIRQEQSQREKSVIPVVKNPAEKPRIIHHTPVPYPADGGGSAGTVVVCILVGYEGRPEYTSLAESSGNRFLDAAAVEHCITWRFKPARDNKGRIVRCLVYIPVTIRP